MNAQLITSRDNEKIRRVCRLLDDPAERQRSGLFVAESAKLCSDISAVISPVEAYYTQAALDKEPGLAQLPGFHFIIAPHVAEKLSRTRTSQGVWTVYPLPEYTLSSLTGRRLVALDGVQDPGNLGAVLRSAAAFGWQGVLLGPGCADAYGMKALRAGMSSTVKIPVVRSRNLAADIISLREQGYLSLAARLEDSQELPPVPSDRPCLMVIGSEGQGISPQVAAVCDISVRIPIAPAMESLNAAVAAAVLMWHYRG